MGGVMKITLLLTTVVIGNSLAQICLKMAALNSESGHFFNLFNEWLFLAVALLGLSFVVWQFLLTQKRLSFLHPFLALAQIIVPALSIWVFHEAVSIPYFLGICCIMLGIGLTSTGTRLQPDEKGI
jgi:drug/metabolite transporter (DMT)-like permease